MNGSADIPGELVHLAEPARHTRPTVGRAGRWIRLGPYALESSALALLGSLVLHAAAFAAAFAWLLFWPDNNPLALPDDRQPVPVVRVRLIPATASPSPPAPRPEARPDEPAEPTLPAQPARHAAKAPMSRPQPPAPAPPPPLQPDLLPGLPPPDPCPDTPAPPPPVRPAVQWQPVTVAVAAQPDLPRPARPTLTARPPDRPGEPSSRSSAGQDGPVALVELPRPDYPQHWYQAGIRGLVVVEVTVLPDGRVGQARVVQSPGYRQLEQLALHACRQARFKPARRDGRPIAQTVRIPFRFVGPDR